MELIEFWTICSSNGIILDKNQLDQLERYQKELIYWNQQVNMISRKDEDNILTSHILHSLSVLKYFDIPKKSNCLDIGTGGGLPGIPISIALPSIKMLLIDSIAKKMKMTDMFAKHTSINTIKTLCIRAEELNSVNNYAKSFDYIFSRAVAKTETMLEWSLSLMKNSAKLILYKGGDLTEEINAAKSKYPGISINSIDIKIFGFDQFEKEEKKLLVCQYSGK